mgnify:FL=1|jgi:hypothetical protein
MAHQPSRWGERQAEEIVDELVNQKSLPCSVETEMVNHLEKGNPVEALDVFLKSRVRENKASD